MSACGHTKAFCLSAHRHEEGAPFKVDGMRHPSRTRAIPQGAIMIIRRIKLLGTSVLALSLAACGTMAQRDKNTAAGAAIGGAAGAILTGGSTTGTVGGAAVGGVIGSQVEPKKK